MGGRDALQGTVQERQAGRQGDADGQERAEERVGVERRKRSEEMRLLILTINYSP